MDRLGEIPPGTPLSKFEVATVSHMRVRYLLSEVVHHDGDAEYTHIFHFTAH